MQAWSRKETRPSIRKPACLVLGYVLFVVFGGDSLVRSHMSWFGLALSQSEEHFVMILHVP